MRVLFFLFRSEKKTDEGHLKQMREGPRNNYFFLALVFCLHQNKGGGRGEGGNGTCLCFPLEVILKF